MCGIRACVGQVGAWPHRCWDVWCACKWGMVDVWCMAGVWSVVCWVVVNWL